MTEMEIGALLARTLYFSSVQCVPFPFHLSFLSLSPMQDTLQQTFVLSFFALSQSLTLQ